MNRMDIRLKQFEIDALINSFKECFAKDDTLWIFGSRVDMSKRGGDIDLYIETNLDSEDAVKARMKFVGDVCETIGDQRIDVVLNLVYSDFHLAIYNVAKDEGVQLV